MRLVSTIVAVLNAAVAVAADASRQLYRVTAPKRVFDETLPSFQGHLDVWHTFSRSNDLYEAHIYATDDQIARFNHTSSNQTTIERDAIDTPTLLESRAAERAACAFTSRRRRLQRGNTTTSAYVNDEFFDCFRQANEIFAFLDRLVDENPTLLTKIPNITTTYEGRQVPAYKLSTGRGRKPLYTQSLIHAREWIAGSSTFYAIAALIDDLRAGRSAATSIFATFDWHFVPILNLDGYLYSWSTDRLWRKNRRKLGKAQFGVDLNRNFGPASFFGKGDDDMSSESYPGTAVLSEPETAGSWAYVRRLNPYGVLDMHSYGGLIMRAYGNQRGTPPAPYGPKLKVLGDAVAQAAGNEYVSETSAQMYVAYGCFDDAVFQLLNRPVLTIEMAGESFIANESTIRPAGQNMYRAFIAFAQQIPTYWKGLDTNGQSTGRNTRNNFRRRDQWGFDDLQENRIERSDR